MSCKWIVAQKLVLLFFSEVSIIIKIFIYDLSNLKKWNNILKKNHKIHRGRENKSFKTEGDKQNIG